VTAKRNGLVTTVLSNPLRLEIQLVDISKSDSTAESQLERMVWLRQKAGWRPHMHFQAYTLYIKK
jgi:hypothetical protein